MKIFGEIALSVNFLDHTQMTRIVKKIVNYFDYKWVGVLFHQPDFLKNCLMLCLVQELNWIHRPFDCEHCLIMLPDSSENIGEAAHSNKIVLVWLVEVGVIALLGNAK